MAKEEKTQSAKAIEKVKKPALPMTQVGFQPVDMESAYRMSEWMAQSDMMTPSYRGKPANCLFLLDMSMGLGVRWQFLMQHLYMVHDRPALDAQATLGLINRSSLFTDPLEYEVEGDDPRDKNYRVRAYATREATGKVLYGPWIDWMLVRGEGWDKKSGSKWLTMPEQMFHYRAASWFANRHCPEVKMGMPTLEEAQEIPRLHVESVTYDQAKEIAAQEVADQTGTVEVEIGVPADEPEEPTQEEEQPVEEPTEPEQVEDEAEQEKPESDDGTALDENEGFRYRCEVCKNPEDVGLDEADRRPFRFAEPQPMGSDDKPGCPRCFSFHITDVTQPQASKKAKTSKRGRKRK